MNHTDPLRPLLFHSQLPTLLVQSVCRSRRQPCALRPRYAAPIRALQTASLVEPVRKRLREEAKLRRRAVGGQKDERLDKTASDWELTVGIEIHAELDTATKLFSAAATSASSRPNSHVGLFDAALPGSQPHFRSAVLLPAIRAALALNCNIQRKSSFDRKHYFYQDQPSGYQITQYYEPFATSGSVTLCQDDGIDESDYPHVTIPIKQIQLEQDTAKTVFQPPSTYLIDFNRVSHPLVEIISMPAIHHPATAAAYVRKVQAILKAVGAATAGMEIGGLRADVNVSVRRRGNEGESEYHGFRGLGTRTEIKNLSSFKSVAEAISIERDRQIAVLQTGHKIHSETRGYSLGATKTTTLRRKEGEIDYRYMPDPDISPLVIGDDLIAHLADTLPTLPDEVVRQLVDEHGLTTKDAKTLREADNGERLDYFFDVLDLLKKKLPTDLTKDPKKLGKTAADWIIHELGALLTFAEVSLDPSIPPPQSLASILAFLLSRQISVDTARVLFSRCFRHHLSNVAAEGPLDVQGIIDSENLRLRDLPAALYEELASDLVEQNPEMARAIREKGQHGKLMWFVGQMMRRRREGEVKLDAKKAEAVVKGMILGNGDSKT